MMRAVRKAMAALSLGVQAALAVRAYPPALDPAAREARQRASPKDPQQMMAQRGGIRTLRAAPTANENAPNRANYDEAPVNPFSRSVAFAAWADRMLGSRR